MRDYGKCTCGACEWFGSMPPNPCDLCHKCGTGPAGRPPPPHDFQVRQVETDEGSESLSYCRWCFKTRGQIARAAASSGKDSGGVVSSSGTVK